MTPSVTALLDLVAGVLFILALRGLSHPETSRQGNIFRELLVRWVERAPASHPETSRQGNIFGMDKRKER